MVVLGEDILTVPTEKIKEIPVDMTIIDGKMVYRNSSVHRESAKDY